VLVLAGEPQAYLPGVIRIVRPDRLMVDSFRLVTVFERALRAGCPSGAVLEAMYAAES
jgi:hypothetical protein